MDSVCGIQVSYRLSCGPSTRTESSGCRQSLPALASALETLGGAACGTQFQECSGKTLPGQGERVWPPLRNTGGHPGFRCAGEELGQRTGASWQRAEQGKPGSRAPFQLELYKHHHTLAPCRAPQAPCLGQKVGVMPVEAVKEVREFQGRGFRLRKCQAYLEKAPCST